MKRPRIKLTAEERAIEREAHLYVKVPQAEHDAIMRIVERHRKEAVLHIRIRQQVLDALKRKAKKHGIKYQTFISEFLTRLAA